MAIGSREGAAPELLTVRDWLRWTASQLARAELHFGHGTDSAWDEAVALVLGWLRVPEDRAEVLLDARLTRQEAAALAACVAQRIEERVPVPYLTGLARFAGLEFEVDSRVLIPRSPMAELLLAGLQPWLGERQPRMILDLATGCGCIGIAAAMAFPEAEVVLADIDAAALDVARRNVRRHGLEDRVRVVASDLFAGLTDETFDVILSNPPYVDPEDLANMPEEFRHEPMAALAGGGADGLELVQQLLQAAPGHLAADGLLLLEVGNSAPALLIREPRLPWLWPELEAGGFGVGIIDRGDLVAGLRQG
ncbi:MAG: 50S ribosomal protein L3 N(5)-glutamine methyltransferase [Gammaproteobacteria bacterium]|nr:50S ribosomal protein L3 N(5)-glutamine methyltransferase [Gammaproteobacteria bacterium]